MSSYRDVRSGSPFPAPVPAIAVGRFKGPAVAPSGSTGDQLRAERGGAPIVPAVQGASGRQLPNADPGTDAPPISRPAAQSAASTGSVATPPDAAPPAPIQSDTPEPVASPPAEEDHHHHHRRWEAHHR